MEIIILPDCPGAGELLAEHRRGFGAMRVDHPSGRPWLVGHWNEADLTLTTAGPRRLAVFGRTVFDTGQAERLLDRARSPQELDRLAGRIPGGVHLIASFDGRVRAQGSVSGSRQVFHADVGGLTFASDSPAPLAALAGAEVDEVSLALRLLSPLAPWPLSQRCVWTGVDALASGHWLDLTTDGRARQVRWWQPPAADRTAGEAALAVREALTEAVEVRAVGHGTVSADLSGGLDSTALCFLAHQVGAELNTYHVTPWDPANEDSRWARRAAEEMSGAAHRILPAERPANWFDAAPADDGPGAGGPGAGRLDTGEGPPLWGAGSAHLVDLTGVVAAEGSRMHLMGVGGDELFGAMPAYLWSLMRSRPLQGIPVVHRYRLLNRWRLADTVRGLADRTPFARYIALAARELTAPTPRQPALSLGWTGGARMPPWATDRAVQLVRGALFDAAASAVAPLDPDRVRHQVLEFCLYEGALIRQTRHACAAFGVEWDAPMLDDRVLEASLSARVADRVRPGRYKPLLVDAMRGSVPDDILDRSDKGEFSAELFEGLRRNRAAFLAMCERLRLAELGLVNPAVLRTALISPSPESRHLTPFQSTVACENWLRTATAPALATPHLHEEH
ncbi:asparagine synthase-related protein [Kitasatospora sp. NPDC097691]|uniref:asparagine synthase-related protein n=1 Tax=Kitasatospora sp. NPDC097691 TaxID=3157231 RepID=UPI00332E1D59